MTLPDSARPLSGRIVLHLSGYDPFDPADQHRRFGRELARFARTWNLTAAASALRHEPGIPAASWTVETAGPNWRNETTYRVLRWDDIVRNDMRRNILGRLGRALLTFVEFVGSGTAPRYFRRHWPYALFFCYPFAALALFAAIAAGVGAVVGGPVGGLAGIATFAALYAVAGRRLRVPQALDDWDFARNYVHGRRPETMARLAGFAEALVESAQRGSAREIVLVGHSFGATLALEVLAQALQRDPQLGSRGPAVRLLTVGATIPKLGLHPRGARVRECAERVASAPGVEWAEYQACDDPISFYKVNPVSLVRQRLYAPGSRPMVRRVHVREMLAPGTYRRFRRRFVRLHYQFVMGNDVRARYDFFMFACGPLAFSELAATAAGPTEAFAADGSLLRRPAVSPLP